MKSQGNSYMYLSIIMPSYNERKNIESGVLASVYEYLEKQTYTWELILSDDGSQDNTLEALREFAKGKERVRVLDNPHRGKGPTVISGLMESKGDWALFTDFDQATPISEIEKLLPLTKKGYQVVVGSREIAGAQRKKEPLHRHIMGKVFNLIVQSVALKGIHDTQCGFKLFSHEAIAKLCPKIAVYQNVTRKDAFTGAFDVELLYLAHKYKYQIAEIPVHWRHIKTDRVSPIKDSMRMFLDLFKIRIADLQGKYS